MSGLGAAFNFTTVAARVRTHLAQDHRYAHCVRVARFAESLARTHGESTTRARLAGMLHDLARLYSAQRLLDESQARGLPIDAYAREHPVVLHAPLGAELAREMFGVDDEGVLSAIRKHTLGAAEMSRLDCILYLADGLEPGRDFPERQALATLALADLAAATAATMRSTFAYLREKGLAAAPQSLQAESTFGRPADSPEVVTGGIT
ncbi:MAG: bis(5'-nucleosyl)-tetraphosphatase (symmetrical) YqeK [Candidatus Eremiobacteraeota bacterium]|nr:bis(5'-nucleosyl)-tetraphosphatase (symmetrical) YqeK [Candidatus Eremiobacteraeota bacterium]